MIAHLDMVKHGTPATTVDSFAVFVVDTASCYKALLKQVLGYAQGFEQLQRAREKRSGAAKAGLYVAFSFFWKPLDSKSSDFALFRLSQVYLAQLCRHLAGQDR